MNNTWAKKVSDIKCTWMSKYQNTLALMKHVISKVTSNLSKINVV